MAERVAAVRLRLYTCEGDHARGKPLYEVVLHEALARGLAGATVFRAAMGFGAHSRLHTASVLALSTNLPIVVEILDTKEKVEAFLPFLDEVVAQAVVTIQDVEMLRYGPATAESPS